MKTKIKIKPISGDKTASFIKPLFFCDFPVHGYFNGKTDGYYGFIFKNGIKKPIYHSYYKKMLDCLANADFFFFACT